MLATAWAPTPEGETEPLYCLMPLDLRAWKISEEEHRGLRDAVRGKKPRVPAEGRTSRVSGIDFLSLEEENRPIIVGERTNVIGSRKFKRLIREEKFEEASEIGRRQVRGGAHIIVPVSWTSRGEAVRSLTT